MGHPFCITPKCKRECVCVTAGGGRYMGHPASNGAGYARSAVTAHVEGIEGALLLVHGLIDENVHFRHTACLINALIQSAYRSKHVTFEDVRVQVPVDSARILPSVEEMIEVIINARNQPAPVRSEPRRPPVRRA